MSKVKKNKTDNKNIACSNCTEKETLLLNTLEELKNMKKELKKKDDELKVSNKERKSLQKKLEALKASKASKISDEQQEIINQLNKYKIAHNIQDLLKFKHTLNDSNFKNGFMVYRKLTNEEIKASCKKRSIGVPVSLTISHYIKELWKNLNGYEKNIFNAMVKTKSDELTMFPVIINTVDENKSDKAKVINGKSEMHNISFLVN